MAKKETQIKNLIPLSDELIERRIYLIRGHKAMLDSDLAELYQVETKALNRAMKRNADRFPDEFMFHLTPTRRIFEVPNWHLKRRPWRPSLRALRLHEHGVAMLSSVLRSKRAVLMSILIVNGFVRLRGILATHRDLAQAIEDLRRKQAEQGEQITAIIETINQLLLPNQFLRSGRSASQPIRTTGGRRGSIGAQRFLWPFQADLPKRGSLRSFH